MSSIKQFYKKLSSIGYESELQRAFSDEGAAIGPGGFPVVLEPLSYRASKALETIKNIHFPEGRTLIVAGGWGAESDVRKMKKLFEYFGLSDMFSLDLSKDRDYGHFLETRRVVTDPVDFLKYIKQRRKNPFSNILVYEDYVGCSGISALTTELWCAENAPECISRMLLLVRKDNQGYSDASFWKRPEKDRIGSREAIKSTMPLSVTGLDGKLDRICKPVADEIDVLIMQPEKSDGIPWKNRIVFA